MTLQCLIWAPKSPNGPRHKSNTPNMHYSVRANQFEVLRGLVKNASNPASNATEAARSDNLPTQLTKSQKKNQRRRAKCAAEKAQQQEMEEQVQEEAQEDQHTPVVAAGEVETVEAEVPNVAPQGAWAAMAAKSPVRPPPVDTSLPSTNECQSPSKQAKDRHGKKKKKLINYTNESAVQGTWEGFEELSPEEQEVTATLSLGATGGNHTKLSAGYRGRYQNRNVRVTKPWRDDKASGRLVYTHSDHNYVEGLMPFLDYVRHHPLVTGCYPGPITSVGRTRSQGLDIALQDSKPHNGNVDVTVYKLKAGNVDKVANAYVVGTLSVSEMEEMIRTYVC